MTTRRRQFPELDGLRAVASVAVVATHTAFAAGMYTRGTFGVATQRLEVGVAIFFVLSGFLLGLPHVERAQRGTAVEPVRRYAVKRVARIVPVYVVTVVVAMLALPENRGADVWTWVANLTLVEHFVSPLLPTGLTQMWSLSVEAAFYAVLPLLGLLLLRVAGRRRDPARATRLTLCALAVGGFVWVVLSRSPGLGADVLTRQLPSHLAWFVAGMLLASLVVDDGTTRLSRTARTLAGERLTCYGLAAAIFAIAATPLAGSPLLVAPTASEALVRHVAYLLVAVLLVAPSVLAPRSGSLLAHPVLRHLGLTSYALFCCHLIVLEIVLRAFDLTLFAISWPMLFALVLGISLLVAELLHQLVERPVVRLARGRSPTGPDASGRDAEATTTATTPSAHH